MRHSSYQTSEDRACPGGKCKRSCYIRGFKPNQRAYSSNIIGTSIVYPGKKALFSHYIAVGNKFKLNGMGIAHVGTSGHTCLGTRYTWAMCR